MKQIPGKLKNIKWVIGYSIFIIGITTLPYLLGFFFQGDKWIFTGFVFGVEDGNSYISKMVSGSTGNWLFRTLYSTQIQSGFFAFFPYILLGKMASNPGLHEQQIALFQTYRILAAFFEIIATYKFISIFIEDNTIQKIGLIITTAGGGLGWLYIIGGNALWGGRLPLEFYSPETFGFLSIYGLPHLAMARGLLLIGLYFYLEGSVNWMNYLYSGISLFFIGLFQPLTIITAWVLLASHNLVLFISNQMRREHQEDRNGNPSHQIMGLISILLISSPFVLYNFIKFRLDPYLVKWYNQNLILSPPISDYFLGFGLLLIPLITGFIYSLKNRNNSNLLLVGWMLSFPLLAYAPYNLQRRLPDGIWVCVVIIALIGIVSYKEKYKIIITTLSILCVLTYTIFFAMGVFAVLHPAKPVFRPADEVDVFRYIVQNANAKDIVLSSYSTGNPLPAWAGLGVLSGLGPESADLASITTLVEKIYNNDINATERILLIKNNHIKYIFKGPEEEKIGPWDPGSSPEFVKVFERGNYQLFKVN